MEDNKTKEVIKHTPLPWSFHKTHNLSSDTWYVLVDPNGRGPIMDVGGKDIPGQISEAKHLGTDQKEVEANARFIVEACNSYYSSQQSTKQLQDKYDALEMVLIKMMQFVPVDERDLFIHTLNTEELRRVEVAEIVAMIRNTKS